MQITDTVLMIRPAAFSVNDQTAQNNHFQQAGELSAERVQKEAVHSFNAMVALLQSKGINVVVLDDNPYPPKPDAVFPNNWFCTNSSGLLSVFPMFAANRRAEKRDEILQYLTAQYEVNDFHDWTEYEAEGMYLEGTGSMVMDHENRIIYAALSPRTHQSLVEKFAAANGYRVIVFTAHDENEREIYHTNVMMCIGEGFAVLCPHAITDHTERIAVAQLLEATGHENIYISLEQMRAFAGNMLQLKNRTGERFIVMSQTAWAVLEDEKKERLAQYGTLLPIDPGVIEMGGGSVRCMLAEIFLQKKK
ncbi:MAG TPA: arginine deiminase-related protein [Flavisolibacter sp.]|nr:arginine deiminase-related protein [Flavisolibacter sp.]